MNKEKEIFRKLSEIAKEYNLVIMTSKQIYQYDQHVKDFDIHKFNQMMAGLIWPDTTIIVLKSRGNGTKSD